MEVEQGVSIYVEDIGEGKPILFIHGWPITHQMYEYQFTQLPKHGYRCIAIDLRGFGNSSYPWEGYSYNRMADDIRSIIDTLQLSNLTLAGFSMGGAIAIRYMARHLNHKVSKLLLLAAAAPSFTQRPGYPYGMTKEAVNAIILETYKDRPEMLKQFGTQFFASHITESFRAWFQSVGLDTAAWATIKCAESLRDEDLRSDLAKVNVPTTIFHGILDKICPFVFAELMNKGIHNSKLIPFEHSGHGIFYDELERFNKELLIALGDVRYSIGRGNITSYL